MGAHDASHHRIWVHWWWCVLVRICADQGRELVAHSLTADSHVAVPVADHALQGACGYRKVAKPIARRQQQLQQQQQLLQQQQHQLQQQRQRQQQAGRALPPACNAPGITTPGLAALGAERSGNSDTVGALRSLGTQLKGDLHGRLGVGAATSDEAVQQAALRLALEQQVEALRVQVQTQANASACSVHLGFGAVRWAIRHRERSSGY